MRPASPVPAQGFAAETFGLDSGYGPLGGSGASLRRRLRRVVNAWPGAGGARGGAELAGWATAGSPLPEVQSQVPEQGVNVPAEACTVVVPVAKPSAVAVTVIVPVPVA